MNQFDASKLKTSITEEMSNNSKIDSRKYTLTHSDETGELFLTISSEYDTNAIDYKIRDEVIGHWEDEGGYALILELQIDIGKGDMSTSVRDKIFRRELPLAIKGIVFGDRKFLDNNNELYNSSVIVKFNSDDKAYNKVEDWGRIKEYKYLMNRENDDASYTRNAREDYNKGNLKDNNIENILLAVLDSYIKEEIFIYFGRYMPYCSKKSEILEVNRKNIYGLCTDLYEIKVGVKVGKILPFDNNMIIVFLIDNINGIKVKDVKILI